MSTADTNTQFYRCECCGGVFQDAWTDAEARAEYQEIFNRDVALEPADSQAVKVCDVCYVNAMQWIKANGLPH